MNNPTQASGTPNTPNTPKTAPSKGPAGYSQAQPKDPLMAPPAGKTPSKDDGTDADDALTQPADKA